jgi:hypothetical protein
MYSPIPLSGKGKAPFRIESSYSSFLLSSFLSSSKGVLHFKQNFAMLGLIAPHLGHVVAFIAVVGRKHILFPPFPMVIICNPMRGPFKICIQLNTNNPYAKNMPDN